MSTTLRTLARQALRDIGCLRPGQTASPDVEAEILESANQMLDTNTLEELLAYANPAAIFTLTAQIEQYRIGSTQVAPHFAAARPTEIAEANCIINTVSPVLREPMRIISAQEWSYIPVRAATPGATAPVYAIPNVLYYDNDFSAAAGYATVNIWPAPVAAYQLELFTNVTMPFTSFADVTTGYLFPPAYEKLIRKGLAVEIAPMMQMNNKLARMAGMLPVSMSMLAKVEQQYAEVKALIQSTNAPESLKVCDPAFLSSGRRGGWNYLTGTYGGGL